MGVNLVGQGAVLDIPQPIVINRIQPSNTTTNNTINVTQTRILVPKGAYSVTVTPSGAASFGASSTGATVGFGGDNGIKYTISSVEADTGRPGPFINRSFSSSVAMQLILPKDSFISVGLYANSTTMQSMFFDVILVPTRSAYTAYPTITGNRNTTATATSSSGSNSDINWGSVAMGWDYDNNSPFLITGGNTTTRSTSWQQLFPTFQIWRFDTTTGKWTFKQWTGMSLASGSWVYGAGFLFHGSWVPGLFIKGNFIHNVVNHAIISDGTNYHGWIKADLTAAGATLTVTPGNTNTAFNTPVANCAGVSSSFFMMYYWDRRVHKVVYAGTISNVFNGTYGANNWRSYWGQWDIATGTNDYTNINSGTADPRSAGNSGATSLVYNVGVPDAKTGFIHAIVPNGTTEYLAKWNRSGTYTGVGSFLSYYPFNTTSQTSLGQFSYENKIDYLPLTDLMVAGNGAANTEYLTGVNQPGLLVDNNPPLPNEYAISYGNYSNYSEDRQTLVMDAGIFVCHVGYIQFSPNPNGTARFSAPITVYKAALNTTNLGQLTPIMGGIPSAATGLPGINNGTW